MSSRAQALDDPQLRAVAPGCPQPDEHRDDGDDDRDHHDRGLHGVQEGGDAQRRESITLRAKRVRELERLRQRIRRRPAHRFGVCGKLGPQAIGVAGGQNRPCDRDTQSGADLARGVVSCRRDALLVVRNGGHDRRSRWGT
jgi:hypothetical protein